MFLSVSGSPPEFSRAFRSRRPFLLSGWQAPTSLAAIAGGFRFSAAVGIFFGYCLARKAASLDPTEALRYE